MDISSDKSEMNMTRSSNEANKTNFVGRVKVIFFIILDKQWNILEY